MKIGYSFWGFLGDHKIKDGKHVSAPDGNATYSWGIINELQLMGHEVLAMQQDRDAEGWKIYGEDLFSAFSQLERTEAYQCMRLESLKCNSHNGFPDLDLLLIEWRWPIPGRNYQVRSDTPAYQPDLDRQTDLLNFYRKTKTKIVVWDLDHKLTELDEKWCNPDMILETSEKPRGLFLKRTSVGFPVDLRSLRQFDFETPDPKKKLVYIGNRYERDDVIEEYIAPFSRKFPGEVEFWGGWTNEPNYSECMKMWPDISYHGRITTSQFHDVYRNAVAVPLLAKRSYLETGFMSPRIWEALLFGTLPVGLAEMQGIEEYLPDELIAIDTEDLQKIVSELAIAPFDKRIELREEVLYRVGKKMNVRLFIDKILSVVKEKMNDKQDKSSALRVLRTNESSSEPVAHVKKIHFAYSDGCKPLRRGTSRSFALRSPLTITIPRKTTTTLNLGISCEYASLILADKGLTSDGVNLKNKGDLIDENETIVVLLENTTDSDYQIQHNDVVCKILAIENTEFEVEND